MTNYLSCADTAKLVRQALKESFPGIKFSVQSKTYSGGGSIDIRWTDGPNVAQVQHVSSAFEGSYFDGMIDYKGSRYHHLDGKPVHLGADFIFENREYSDAAIERALRTIAAKYSGNWRDFGAQMTVEAFRKGALYNLIFFYGGHFDSSSAQAIINQTISKQSDRFAPEPSATLARVKFTGDDGYGAGTIGRDGTGTDTSLGYPRYERKVQA